MTEVSKYGQHFALRKGKEKRCTVVKCFAYVINQGLSQEEDIRFLVLTSHNAKQLHKRKVLLLMTAAK